MQPLLFITINFIYMGTYKKNIGIKGVSSSKTQQVSKQIQHRARVLSTADVEANRSRAYTYLSL